MESYFSQDGHLLDLTLERLVDGELPRTDLSEHLDGCAACAARHDAIVADSAVALPPLRRLQLVAPTSPHLTRSGHLTDLALERIVDGEQLDEIASAHLDSCAACTARHSAIVADSAVALPPLRLAAPAAEPVAEAPAPQHDNVIPFRQGRSWWSAAGGLLAAAAAVLFLVNVSPTDSLPDRNPEDNFTIRGSELPELDLEVYRSDADDITRISSDDVVFPGDRLGFRVGSEADGHFLILGIDSTGSAYPCYPTDGSSAAIQHGKPAEVPGAINLDDTLGIERLVAVRCPDTPSFDDLAHALERAASGLSADSATPQLREQCAQQEVRLRKEPRQ